MGDNPESAIRDIELSLNHGVPIVVVRGSQMSEKLAEMIDNNTEKD